MKRIIRNKGIATWLVVLIIAVVIAAVIFLANGGFGFGGGKGDGEGDGETVEAAATAEEPEIKEIEYIDITVSGSIYIYKNKEITLDELISELTSAEDRKPLKITDENASQKAYSRLKKALDENGLRYIEESAENIESEDKMV